MAYLERSKVINASDVVINPATNEALTEGEIVQTLEALRMAVVSLTKSIGSAYPDTSGRLRVALDSITASLTLATVTTVGTVTAMTNQVSAGSYAMNDQVPALTKISAAALRNNITVS